MIDRAALQEKVRNWRLKAEPAGPLHSLWNAIFDAEALLRGENSFLSYSQLMEID